MHHLDTIDGIIALAETGPGVEPGEALNVLATIISDMDPQEAHYKERVAGLVLVGATRALMLPFGGRRAPRKKPRHSGLWHPQWRWLPL